MKMPKLRWPAWNKTWAILGTALAIGLVAAFATRSFLNTQVAEIEARGQHQTVDVVVAKTAIEKGTVVSSQNLAVRKIPVEYAHSGAVKPGEFDRIEGRPIAHKVNPGEMIMWSQMAGKRLPTFSARLVNGRRAITVAVDEINSISGMLEPGDFIDMMLTVEQNGKKSVLTLLQSMEVMATGQRSVDDPKSGERTSYATVTLDATPEQAKKIIIARESGKLTALLRNPDDKQAIGNGDMALPGATSAARQAAPRREIPVLYGGSGARLAPEALHLAHTGNAIPPPPPALPAPPPAAVRPASTLP